MSLKTKLDSLAKLDFETLQSLHEQYQFDESDEGKAIFHKVKQRLSSARHDDIHPHEDYYEIDVPLAVDGSYFTIGDRAYFGPSRVPGCVLEYLTWMIDQNRQVEKARMREHGAIGDLGDIGRRAAIIQAE